MEDVAGRSLGLDAAETMRRMWSFRWRGGPEQLGRGRTPAAAAFSLGYGFDDFKDLTWEERA